MPDIFVRVDGLSRASADESNIVAIAIMRIIGRIIAEDNVGRAVWPNEQWIERYRALPQGCGAICCVRTNVVDQLGA